VIKKNKTPDVSRKFLWEGDSSENLKQKKEENSSLGTEGSLVVFEDCPLLYKEEAQITERLLKH